MARAPGGDRVAFRGLIDELQHLALDLTWTWDSRIRELFKQLDPQLWEEAGHNPIVLLHRLGPEGAERALDTEESRSAMIAARYDMRALCHRRSPYLPAG